MAVGALATAARALAAEDPPLARAFPVDGAPPRAYLAAAQAAAGAVRGRLWDARAHRLKRSFCRSASAVDAFADDCAPPSALPCVYPVHAGVLPPPGRGAVLRAVALRSSRSALEHRQRLCAALLPKRTALTSAIIPSTTSKTVDQTLARSPPNGKRSSTAAGWYRQSARQAFSSHKPCPAMHCVFQTYLQRSPAAAVERLVAVVYQAQVPHLLVLLVAIGIAVLLVATCKATRCGTCAWPTSAYRH